MGTSPRRLVISAPFGNYSIPGTSHPNVVRTLGTYTLYPRAGLLRRLWRVVMTVKYVPFARAWINRLGLPNPGIDSLLRSSLSLHGLGKFIVSVHGFNPYEWIRLAQKLTEGMAILFPGVVELNLSCPNVGSDPSRAVELLVKELRPCVYALRLRGVTVQAKLPPVNPVPLAEALHSVGVTHFHAVNTLALPHGGGMSGKPLLPLALEAVRRTRLALPDAVMTGGGGVSHLDDVKRFVDAGADHVAVGSMLFNPLNWAKLYGMASHLFSLEARS